MRLYQMQAIFNQTIVVELKFPVVEEAGITDLEPALFGNTLIAHISSSLKARFQDTIS